MQVGLSFLHLLYAYYFMIHGVQRKLYSWIYTFHISFNFFETIGVALYELFLIFIKFPLCEPAHSVFKMAISKLLIICLYQVTKNRYLSKQHSVLPMKQLILYILLSFCSIVNICLNAKIGYSVTIPRLTNI